MKKILILSIVFFVQYLTYGQDSLNTQKSTDNRDKQVQLTERKGTQQARYLLKTAIRLMDKGLFKKSEFLLTQSIDLQPNNIDTWNFRATCRERLQKPDRAIQDYNQVLKFDPMRYAALFSRSVLYYETRRFPLAIEGFDKLLNLPKTETQAIYFKGTNYNTSGETKMDKIVSLNEQDAEVYHYRGLAKLSLKYKDGALTDFNKAIELNTEEPDYYVNRGLIYLEKKDTLQAIADLQSALELDPEHSLALYNLSLAGRNHKAALTALDKVVSIEDGFPSAYANRAYARLESRDYIGAIADYDTAIMLDPSQPEYFSNRGIAQKKARRYQQAIRDFSQAIRLDNGWAKNYALRGEVYFKTRKYSDAIEDFSAAIAYNPSKGNYYYNRALARRRVGLMAECCSDLRQAINLGTTSAMKALAAYCKEK
ncbi:MAG: tetratricopeptide repeat protein [Bacteroidota bacterium]